MRKKDNCYINQSWHNKIQNQEERKNKKKGVSKINHDTIKSKIQKKEKIRKREYPK